MTEKLSEYEITSRDGPFINAECNAKIINTLVRKINELVDAVNAIQKEREAVRKSVNIHEKQIDELQMKVNKLEEKVNFAQPEVKENVQDKFAEQHNQYGIFGADKVEKRCYAKDLSSYILALEIGNKDLSDKIGKLETELERTRKVLEIIKKEMNKETMPDFAVIRDALKGVGDE